MTYLEKVMGSREEEGADREDDNDDDGDVWHCRSMQTPMALGVTITYLGGGEAEATEGTCCPGARLPLFTVVQQVPPRPFSL